mmetsp:Transcript_58182/g.112255  ORF Transcript_58182/g.112255 Transcript_58182/m.112255 type:complete len:209 (+) Transcript_58182:414-1040(+)
MKPKPFAMLNDFTVPASRAADCSEAPETSSCGTTAGQAPATKLATLAAVAPAWVAPAAMPVNASIAVMPGNASDTSHRCCFSGGAPASNCVGSKTAAADRLLPAAVTSPWKFKSCTWFGKLMRPKPGSSWNGLTSPVGTAPLAPLSGSLPWGSIATGVTPLASAVPSGNQWRIKQTSWPGASSKPKPSKRSASATPGACKIPVPWTAS